MYNIRKLREAKGMTQEQLALASGVHRVAIVRYENTDRGMTMETASKLAAALGCTIDELQWREDETAENEGA